MSIVLNFIAIVGLFLVFVVTFGILNTINLLTFGKKNLSFPALVCSFLFTIASVSVSIYTSYLALQHFNVDLSFIVVLIWASLQTLGASRDGSKHLMAMSSPTEISISLPPQITHETMISIFTGEFWGLIIGSVGAAFLLQTV